MGPLCVKAVVVIPDDCESTRITICAMTETRADVRGLRGTGHGRSDGRSRVPATMISGSIRRPSDPIEPHFDVRRNATLWVRYRVRYASVEQA
jgi:hypothetical protein